MPVSELVDEVKGVEAGVVGDSPGDDFKGLGEHVHHELLFAGDLDCVFLELLGEFHLGGSSSSYDLVGLEASSYDHDGIVEGPLSFLDELLGSSSEDDGG